MVRMLVFNMFALMLLGILPAPASAGLPPVVSHVDVQRYLGTWYEVARLPARFQRGCHATTATYLLRDDGRLDVVNRCRKGSATGKKSSATGVAWVVDKTTNAKLKVRFFWPFTGDYWIFSLGEDYDYAMVGSPDRKYLWILSRTPTMEPDLYNRLTTQAQSLGFDTDPLIRSEHPPEKATSSP